MIANFINNDNAFSSYSFDRLMNNNLKRLNVLRSFAKKRLTKDFLKDKNVLEINATNSGFANYLLDNGAYSYSGVNFDPDIVFRLNKENKNTLVNYSLLENNMNFSGYNDIDLVLSFDFVESLSRFELFPFFDKGKEKLQLHSILNNKEDGIGGVINKVIDTSSPNVHDMDYLLSALGNGKTWSIDNSSSFRGYSIIYNF